MRIQTLILVAALSRDVVAQTSRTDTLHRVTAVGGRIRFAVPKAWGVFAERTTDSLEQYVYSIRKPGIDTLADVSTNLLINVRKSANPRPFQAATNAWLAGMLDSATLVLHDTTIGPAQRAVFWRDTDGPWIYVGFDDFAERSGFLIHVRIVEPLSDATPARWDKRFEIETRTALQSITVDGQRAFPAPVGYPATVRGPSPTDRPAGRLLRPLVAARQSPWLRLASPGPDLTLHLDTTSIVTIGDSTFGSFRWTGLYPGDTTDRGVKFAYAERNVIATCRTGKVALEAVSFYAPSDTIIDGTFWEEREWEFMSAPSRSFAAFERDVLCEFARRRSRGTAPRAAPRAFVLRPTKISAESHELRLRPMFAGFRIGQPLRVATPLVGLPQRTDTVDHAAPMLSISNSKTGITLVATPPDGVVSIFATSRTAGALDGIRVGDSRADAMKRWGPPAAGSDHAAMWLAGQWVVSISSDSSGRITRVGIAR